MEQPGFTTVLALNGVTVLKANNLGCPHGFSTRLGGHSTLPATASLNLGMGLGCEDATVWQNLCRFGEAAEFDPASLVALRQVHGSTVRTAHTTDAGLGYSRASSETADGYVTAEWGVTLGIRTADCVPILASATDSGGKVVAVGAFHAGWRGTVGQIVRAGVEALCRVGEPWGVTPERIEAALGPGIHACCFEIGEDVREQFAEGLGEALTARYVFSDAARPGKYRADLYGLNREILLHSGVPEDHIVVTTHCTACNRYLFYSHRRDARARGSLLSVIRLP